MLAVLSHLHTYSSTFCAGIGMNDGFGRHTECFAVVNVITFKSGT